MKQKLQNIQSIKAVPFILIYSLLASSMETDVSVPGFPAMAEYFNTTVANIQSTLSLNLLGFCISALFFGPLADSYGRKKVMIAGFMLFSLCSIGCVVTENLYALLTLRFLQGLGASSMWVIAYAIIADIYQGAKAMHYINVMNAVVTAAMAVAPAFGAILCAVYGWKSTYLLIAILSVSSLFLFMFFLPETNIKQQPLELRRIIRDYKRLITNYDFMLHVLAPSFLCIPYMAYIACASFLYIRELHMSYAEYAIHQSIVIATFSILSFYCDWFIRKVGENNALKYGLITTITGMTLIIPLTLLFPTSAFAITIPMTLDSAGISVCFGIAVARSMEFFPDLKATASSLMMAIRVALCSIGVIIGAEFYDGTLFTSGVTIAGLSVMGITSGILTYQYSTRSSNLLRGNDFDTLIKNS
jgi:MFS transporter, DHA1 family, multidrug resistance protein